jgi:O-antigen/teichoic acid export membrane protein
MRIIAFGLIFQNLLMAAAIFLLVRSPQSDLWLVPAIQVVSECFLILWYYRYLRARFGSLRPVFNWTQLLPTLKETLHLSLGRFPRIFYYQGDILLLAWLASAANAGEFLASHKIILSIVMVGIIYQTNALPVTSRLAAASPVNALRFQMNILRYVLISIVPLVVLGVAYADLLIHFIYGSTFSASAPIFFWMLFTVPIFAANLALQDMLIAVRRNDAFTMGTMTIMALHIAVGIWIIPGYGGTGAALACLAGELIGLLLLTAFVWRSIGHFPFSWRMFAPIAAGIPMYVVLQNELPWPYVSQIALGLLAYAAIAALLRAVTRHEMRHIWNYLRRLLNLDIPAG